ncbi:MAG: flagellar export chaperone FlgN [Planctomycetota bacterium]|jgi:hypothetical protein
MKTTTPGIEDKIDELLACLDTDIEHIKKSLSRLNELRSLVVKRDDASLGKLLESIRTESDNCRKNELRRQSVRKELAIALDCGIEQVTLSSLDTVLPEEQKVQVAERKSKLQSLAEELKREHLSTALLLAECARFNRLLLKSIFDLGRTGMVYYGSDGSTKRQIDTAFMNLQF